MKACRAPGTDGPIPFAERLERNTADLAVLQEYKRRDEEFRKRAEEFESVSRQWDAAKVAVTELRNERLVQFMQGFGIISNKLKEMYQVSRKVDLFGCMH